VNVRIGRWASQGSAVTVLSILKKVTVQKHLSFEVEAILNKERGKDKIKQGYGILRDHIQVNEDEHHRKEPKSLESQSVDS
jgi:transposase